MPRVKIARKSTVTDMTAMCDVAFLLLTFFIMTAKFKQEDPVPVAIPGYSKTTPVPEDNLATIIVGGGKAFFSVEGAAIRTMMLEEVGKIYSVNFTPDEKKKFAALNSFGVPVSQLKQFLALDPADQKKFPQTGVPTDSVSNELFNWIKQARLADRAITGKAMYIAIKGDSKEEYPTIGRVISVLQKQKVNKFSLITSSKEVK